MPVGSSRELKQTVNFKQFLLEYGLFIRNVYFMTYCSWRYSRYFVICSPCGS